MSAKSGVSVPTRFGTAFQHLRIQTRPGVEIVQLGHPEGDRATSSGLRDSESTSFAVVDAAGAGQIQFSTTGRIGRLLERLKDAATVQSILEPNGLLLNEVKKLVLDRVLQIVQSEDAVSGIDATTCVGVAQIEEAAFTGNACLSFEALQYAAALRIEDVRKLSAKLYFYNRVPVQVSRRRLLESPQAVLAFVSGSNTPSDLLWAYAAPELGRPWHYWRSRWSQRERHTGSYKLYVSPAVDAIRPVFSEVLAMVDDSVATGFKIASEVSGLHRPDKIVIYFSNVESLKTFAAKLLAQIRGSKAQPVPFTADLGHGLLSWGVDPGAAQPVRASREQVSWRTFICDTLARAILVSEKMGTAAARFALQRIQLEGVDPHTWEPLGEEV